MKQTEPIANSTPIHHEARSRAGAPTSCVKLSREELERGSGLRLLLAEQVDPEPRQIGAGLGGDLERLAGPALRRQLEDPRSVRIEPHLRDHPPLVALGRELELKH